ncbi:hypothetical protein NQ317_014594 [Molorchus minor]|uniref:Uncharacterized protein n=1 Tax=Molorchus minor TaxID=1323400 RepID=A0ABQ9K3R4_9CUCU|nr:hypothetical protein NQ317_014594 [Molorchus minor]
MMCGSGTSSGGTGDGGNGLTNILSNIDLPGLLRGVNSFVKVVGVFCPPLSQVLDNVIQNVTSTAFRIFGSAILRSGGLGGGNRGGGGQRVSVVLPTFPPDEDDDEDDDSNNDTDADINSATTSESVGFNADLLSRQGFDESSDSKSSSSPLVLSGSASFGASASADADSNAAISVSDIRLPSNTEEVSNSETTTIISGPNEETEPPSTLFTVRLASFRTSFSKHPLSSHLALILARRGCSPADEESNVVAKRHVRVPREAEAEEEEEDQDGAESAPQPAEDVNIDDQDRNKRYLPFGGGAEGHGASAGSGNFLFDIIRVSNGS